PDSLRFGILDMLKVTVLSSLFALVIEVPVALELETYLVQYANARLSRAFSAVIDLLAAVPSIIYGMWGLLVLGPWMVPFAEWLNRNLGWLFLFSDGNVSISGGGTIFTAGVVLAIMILPIITSMSRETIRQTPSLHQEAALALGATKWEKIRMTCFPYAKSVMVAGAMLALGRALGEPVAVLIILRVALDASKLEKIRIAFFPYAKSGMVAGAMLALGRALGETVAVLIILSAAVDPSVLSLFDGGFTFASKIASASAEFNHPLPTGAYI